MINLVILAMVIIGCAFAEPYHAHPHKDFQSQEWAQSNFLATEALSRIAQAYDSTGEEDRQEFLKTLLNDEAANTIHQLKYVNDYESEKLKRLESQVKSWQRNFPRTSLNLGDKASVTMGTEQLLLLSHKLARLSYKLSGLDKPTTVQGVLNESIFGPSLVYQSEQVKTLNEAAAGICSAEHNKLDEHATGFMKLARSIRKRLPGAVASTADEMVLGENKSCSGLSSDVMEIVSPHLGILRASPDKPGQLEGTSIFLAEKLFENKMKPLESPLTKLLMKMDSVKNLDKNRPIQEAVAQALGMSATDPRLINLFSIAGHNHGLETYVLKLSLELNNNQDEAIKTGLKMYRAINHLYGLINGHQKQRKASGGKDILATAARPYHYWGGALVACELSKRGYKPWISQKVSTTLGSVYEKWTEKSSGEGIASSQEDIKLHQQGAKDWAERCKK